MPIDTRDIAFQADGRTLAGFLADGSGGRPAPGILVVHEGRGWTRHPRDRAVMLAELGYVAFAPDYLGAAAASLDHAFELMRPFEADRRLFSVFGQAALDVLRTHPNVDAARLAAIGFCWGGYAVLELACFAELRCVVGFHPGLSLGPLSDPANISAKVLICVGDQDPYVPMSDVRAFVAEMRAAQVDTQVLLLVGAPHSFTNPEPYAYTTGVDGVGYDPVADRRAWRAMQALFDETLRPGAPSALEGL
jgi:dienelactone hydrolase